MYFRWTHAAPPSSQAKHGSLHTVQHARAEGPSSVMRAP